MLSRLQVLLVVWIFHPTHTEREKLSIHTFPRRSRKKEKNRKFNSFSSHAMMLDWLSHCHCAAWTEFHFMVFGSIELFLIQPEQDIIHFIINMISYRNERQVDTSEFCAFHMLIVHIRLKAYIYIARESNNNRNYSIFGISLRKLNIRKCVVLFSRVKYGIIMNREIGCICQGVALK